jgi:FMN-dependent NADH-azoreductase
VKELKLYDQKLAPLGLAEMEIREKAAKRKDFSAEVFALARQFACAETIVIAAPYWDLSFPAILKIYLEQIMVSGITFEYSRGIPCGLCKAKRLTYVTTSGGPIFADFGYEYVKALAKNFYGINETKAYRAMNLDVNMITADDVLTKAEISVIE